ncbi:MAG: hypothetical protein Fur0032_13210 [Terrimicrobiaceae bacterium]
MKQDGSEIALELEVRIEATEAEILIPSGNQIASHFARDVAALRSGDPTGSQAALDQARPLCPPTGHLRLPRHRSGVQVILR